MTKNVSVLLSEKPLLGAVLCCTSIAPEQRSILAAYAEQMGAEHKLDLTSDVTHLLVGSTDTPKYQYVAREREDVKVLHPQWVEAVRQCWMEDRVIDMNSLDAEHRVPTFGTLKICITGFDDLNARAEIANTVRKHGGEYTGDLTKDVTHLIAAEPTGKKYEYATIWQKKIVSLKWYHDTLERGMQLDESKYHPAIPLAEQGIGAWNRQERTGTTVTKRARDSLSGPEPPRKLRRTASSRLGSQTDNMWGDIVGAQTTEQRSKKDEVPSLRLSKSMPIVRAADSFTGFSDDRETDKDTRTEARSDRCLAGIRIFPHGFDHKKACNRLVVESTLGGLGAQIVETTASLLSEQGATVDNSFIMVPHQCRQSSLPFLEKAPFQPKVVTELWLEKCMVQKSFIAPDEYPLGRIVEEIPTSDIASLIVNATGFASIETLHVSKTVNLTGARYTEFFTPQSSVLICKSNNVNQAKLFHAQQWNIPAVTEQWLWEFLRSGCVPPFSTFLIHDEQESSNDLHQQFKRNRDHGAGQAPGKTSVSALSKALERGFTNDRMKDRAPPSHSHSGEMKASDKPANSVGSRQQYHGQARNGSLHVDTISAVSADPDGRALKEVSPNFPIHKAVHAGTALTLGNQSEVGDVQKAHRTKGGERVGSPQKLYRDAETMNLAIQDLLNIKTRAQSTAHAPEVESRGPKKKRLLGRALSNLSNSSRNSQPRLSRASSIDSLNTEGLGSELAPPSGTSQGESSGRVNRSLSVSLVGRARAPSKPSLAQDISQPVDLSDPNLCRDEYSETEQGPQLTQLGYEDSEEAIALREQLAEKRRARARLGQQEGDPEPVVKPHERDGPRKRVIKDDEMVLALEGQAGWGGGRRTRRREKEFAQSDGF